MKPHLKKGVLGMYINSPLSTLVPPQTQDNDINAPQQTNKQEQPSTEVDGSIHSPALPTFQPNRTTNNNKKRKLSIAPPLRRYVVRAGMSR